MATILSDQRVRLPHCPGQLPPPHARLHTNERYPSRWKDCVNFDDKRPEVIGHLFSRLARRQIVFPRVEHDRARFMPKDQQVDIIDQVYDLRPANPRLTIGIFGKYLARSHNLILELPTNTIPPGEGGISRSCCSNAAIAFTHLLVGVLTVLVSIMAAPYPARRAMAQETMMAKVNQMIPLSARPNRFSLHMETNE
jgi:hypothetical protein